MKRLCKVCGEEYEYCYGCEKIHSWRALTDTADHYYILNVLMEYQVTHNAKQAYNALRKRHINLKNTGEFLPSVQKILEEIDSLSRENSRVKKSTIKPKDLIACVPVKDEAEEP